MIEEKPLMKGVAFKEKTITIEQFKKVLKSISEVEDPFLVLYFENLYLLALETGAREGELLDLKKEDFDLDSKIVRMIITKKKYRYPDVKPLSEAMIIRLRKHFQQYETEIEVNQNYIFFSLKDFFMSKISSRTVRNRQVKYIKKAGLDQIYKKTIDGRVLYRFSFHSIRHLSGQVVCDKYGIYATKNHLNHTSLNSTLCYLDSNQEIKKEISSLFNKIMGNDESKQLMFQFVNLLLQNKIQNNTFKNVNDSNILLGDFAKFFQKKNEIRST